MTNATKKITDVQLGEQFMLIHTENDERFPAELRRGGRSGGAIHDVFVARLGDDEVNAANLPNVYTDSEDAEIAEISL